MSGKVIIFSAPSGAGKSTVVNHLLGLHPEFEFSVSATSRPPRGTERDGVEYYFISARKFRSLIRKDAFVEYEEVYHDRFYGTLKSEVERIWGNGHVIVFDVDVKGGVNLKKYFGDAALSVLIVPPSMEVLESRLRGRIRPRQVRLRARQRQAGGHLPHLGGNRKRLPMRIAVYSGSFDPLHTGHLAIMERLSASPDYDWTYLVISPQNPLKDASKALSAERRYRAAVEAVRRHPGLYVWVDDIELKMPAPTYTIKTLDALREREPGNEFTLVIGADNLDIIHRWREAPRILREYGVAVYPRSGYDAPRLREALLEECPDYRIRLIDAPLVDISSTQIREMQAQGLDASAWLM